VDGLTAACSCGEQRQGRTGINELDQSHDTPWANDARLNEDADGPSTTMAETSRLSTVHHSEVDAHRGVKGRLDGRLPVWRPWKERVGRSTVLRNSPKSCSWCGLRSSCAVSRGRPSTCTDPSPHAPSCIHTHGAPSAAPETQIGVGRFNASPADALCDPAQQRKRLSYVRRWS
jgi:hypothetical protein